MIAVGLRQGCVLIGPDFVTPDAPQMSRWVRYELAAYQQYSGVTERRGPEAEATSGVPRTALDVGRSRGATEADLQHLR